MKWAVKFAANRPKRSGGGGLPARVRAMGARRDVVCPAWVQPNFTDARDLHRRHGHHDRRKSLFVYSMGAKAASDCAVRNAENGDVAVHISAGW